MRIDDSAMATRGQKQKRKEAESASGASKKARGNKPDEEKSPSSGCLQISLGDTTFSTEHFTNVEEGDDLWKKASEELEKCVKAGDEDKVFDLEGDLCSGHVLGWSKLHRLCVY